MGYVAGSEMSFSSLPIGQLYCCVVDARLQHRKPLAAVNVYRKVSATKYEPLSKAFTGTHRFPSITVAIVEKY